MVDEIDYEYKGIRICIPLNKNITIIDNIGISERECVINALWEAGLSVPLDCEIVRPDWCEPIFDRDTLYIINDLRETLALHPELIDIINSGKYKFLAFGGDVSDISADIKRYGTLKTYDNVSEFSEYAHVESSSAFDRTMLRMKEIIGRHAFAIDLKLESKNKRLKSFLAIAAVCMIIASFYAGVFSVISAFQNGFSSVSILLGLVLLFVSFDIGAIWNLLIECRYSYVYKY